MDVIDARLPANLPKLRDHYYGREYGINICMDIFIWSDILYIVTYQFDNKIWNREHMIRRYVSLGLFPNRQIILHYEKALIIRIVDEGA